MTGSIVAEGPCSWQWIGACVPRLEDVQYSVESPTFRYQDTEWYLRCCETWDGVINLWLYPKTRPLLSLVPFSAAAWMLVKGSDSDRLIETVELRRSLPLVWKKMTVAVELMFPRFMVDRLLTFRIDIKEKDPQIVCKSARVTAPRCPRPEMHTKTFADASVETSLSSISISCLAALSEDFSKMLDADSDLDVEILCKDHSTRAHKSVLCTRSPVLAKMLHSDTVGGRTGVVKIQDMDVDTFRRFLRYLYTGKLDEDALTFDSAMSLCKAGVIYGVISLRTVCSDFLRAKFDVQRVALCKVLALADAHADTGFAEVVSVKEILESIQEDGTAGERRDAPIAENHVDESGNSECEIIDVLTIPQDCPDLCIMRSKRTYADASVQTSLTSISLSCLDALSEDFSKALDADSDLDVEIHCKGHSTRAHKSVLCSRSAVLARMLQSDVVEERTGEINIRDMDVDTFRRFLLYLYTGKLDEDSLTFDSAMSLYEAGDTYEVISLKTLCSDFLRSNLTFDNAYEVLVVAHALGDTSFAEAVTAYILEKEFPQSSDLWPAFCDGNPVIACKVLNELLRRWV